MEYIKQVLLNAKILLAKTLFIITVGTRHRSHAPHVFTSEDSACEKHLLSLSLTANADN
jgi:hypothetical protein